MLRWLASMTCVLTYQVRTLTANTAYSDHDHVHGEPSLFIRKDAEQVQGMAKAPTT